MTVREELVYAVDVGRAAEELRQKGEQLSTDERHFVLQAERVFVEQHPTLTRPDLSWLSEEDE